MNPFFVNELVNGTKNFIVQLYEKLINDSKHLRIYKNLLNFNRFRRNRKSNLVVKFWMNGGEIRYVLL